MNIKDKFNKYAPQDRGVGDWQKIAYENLSNAIIESACDEYVDIVVKANGNIHYNDTKLYSLIKFFNSEWYHTLTNVDTEYLIKELNIKARSIIKEKQEKAKERAEGDIKIWQKNV